jgi:hypothetical protein
MQNLLSVINLPQPQVQTVSCRFPNQVPVPVIEIYGTQYTSSLKNTSKNIVAPIHKTVDGLININKGQHLNTTPEPQRTLLFMTRTRTLLFPLTILYLLVSQLCAKTDMHQACRQ